MKELSLNILDIANNSIRAGAKNITIIVKLSRIKDTLSIKIIDDGCGMDEELLKHVTDPFTTTRNTRRVGMGLPFFKMAAEMSGGCFSIESAIGRGTAVTAVFGLSNIDRPPLGDMAGTMTTLIQGAPDIDFIYEREDDRGGFTFKSAEIRDAVGCVCLSEPQVLKWIGDYITENEALLEKA
jgi:hypothetical protein